MKLPKMLLKQLLRLHERALDTPFFHLRGYMLRGWVLGDRCPLRNDGNTRWHGRRGGWLYRVITKRIAIRAHTTLRSDRERDPHDHPCDNISIVLAGGYWEVLEPSIQALRYPEFYLRVLGWLEYEPPWNLEPLARLFNIHWRGPGSIVYRRATDTHKLILPAGTKCKSIFILGRKKNEWGFKTAEGKVPHAEYFVAKPGEAA